MSNRKTEHLKLHAWDPLDQFTREEFNENFELIDGGFGTVDENAKKQRTELEARIAAEAATAASAAAAAKSAAAAAQSTADTAKSAAATAQSTANGRPQIKTGYYTGSGTDRRSSSEALSIDFGFQPKVVFLATNGNADGMTQDRPYNNYGTQPDWLLLTRDMAKVKTRAEQNIGTSMGMQYYDLMLTWSGNTLKFYVGTLYGHSVAQLSNPGEASLNKNGVRYRWVAIG